MTGHTRRDRTAGHTEHPPGRVGGGAAGIRTPRQTRLPQTNRQGNSNGSSFVFELTLHSPSPALPLPPAPEQGGDPPTAFPAHKQPPGLGLPPPPSPRRPPAARQLPPPAQRDPAPGPAPRAGKGTAAPTAGNVPARLPRDEARHEAAPAHGRAGPGPGSLRCRPLPAEPAGHPPPEGIGVRWGREDQHTHLLHEPRAGRRAEPAGPPVTGETAAPRRAAGNGCASRQRQQQGLALGRTLPATTSGARQKRFPGAAAGGAGATAVER